EEIQRILAPKKQVILYPGINQMDDEDYEKAKPDLAIIMKRKSQDPKKASKAALEEVWFLIGGKKVNNFFKLPPINSQRLIAETVSPDTLQLWESKETRESIRVALVKQMEAVKVDPRGDDGLMDSDMGADEVGADHEDVPVRTQPQSQPAAKAQPAKAK